MYWLQQLSAEAELEPALIGCSGLWVSPDLLFYQRPVQIQCALFVCGCVCVFCFDGWFVFGCCHCCPSPFSFKLQRPPTPSFSSLCCQSHSFSFLFFRKGLRELCFNFYTFSPRTFKSLCSCPLSLFFKLLPLSLSFSNLLLSPLFCGIIA